MKIENKQDANSLLKHQEQTPGSKVSSAIIVMVTIKMRGVNTCLF